jgi:hypothetical protein
MRTLAHTSRDLVTSPSLYPVSGAVARRRTAPLVPIQVDLALTLCRSPRQETTSNPLTGQEANDADRLAAEQLTSSLPCGS